MKKLLLTGATGFLGRHMLPELSHHYKVTTLARSAANDITTDLSTGTPQLPERYDIVVHAAGKAHTTDSATPGEPSMFDVNYQGTVNLCRALEQTGAPQYMVYISSSSVYGLAPQDFVEEDAPLSCRTPYGLSKIMAEKFLQQWCTCHDVVLTILRPALLAAWDAPGNFKRMREGIKKHTYINIDGGCARKSILLADDVARAIPFVLEKGGIYNICDSRNPDVAQLSSAMAKRMGCSAPVFVSSRLLSLLSPLRHLCRRFPVTPAIIEKLTVSTTCSNARILATGWLPTDVVDSLLSSPLNSGVWEPSSSLSR